MLKKLFQRRQTIPPQVRDAVRDAADSLLTSMFGPGPESSVREGNETSDGVVGVIGFDGDVAYTFAVVVPDATAIRLALDFAGMELAADDPNMLYVVGELANLIAGDLVARMEQNQLRTRMSLPALARGMDLLRSMAMGREVIEMRFGLPQGEVFCKLAGGPPFEQVNWPGQ